GNIIPAGTGLNKYGGIEVDFLHEEEEKVEGIFKEVEREQKGKEVNIFKEKNEDNKEQITNNSIIQGP
ncbi:MAG: hypothetical protein COZ07_02880, partial [Candidatus Infernicultor aquiphilus]